MTIFYKPGDVVIALFPFDDRQAAKPRPVLIVSTRKFNDAHEKIMALMITTASNASWPSDTVISHIESCNLPHPSTVRMKCFTLDVSLVKKHIGHIHKSDWTKVKQQLHSTLGLQ